MLSFWYGLIFNNFFIYKTTNYHLSLFPLACDSDFDCEGKQICNEIIETVSTCECEHSYFWNGLECEGECFFIVSNISWSYTLLKIMIESKLKYAILNVLPYELAS